MQSSPTPTSHQAVVAASTSPTSGGDAEGGERGASSPPRGRGAAADEPQRPDPVLVGAADAVGVVVGVVHADLQRSATTSASTAFHQTVVALLQRDRRCRPAPARPRPGSVRGGACEPLRREVAMAGDLCQRMAAREQPATRRPAPPGRSSRCCGSGTRRRPRPARDRDVGVDRLAEAGACSPATRCGPRRWPPHERLGGPGQWVLNLPPTYVAGRAGALPVGGGRDRAGVTTTARPCADGRALRLAGADPAGPAARTTPTAATCAGFDAVLVGGGPLDPEVRAAGRGRGIRVVQTYGMSETCGGCVYDGLPLDGVEVRIGDDGRGAAARADAVRRLRGRPGADRGVLRDGWFHTSDLGRIDDGRPAAGHSAGSTT